MNCIRLNPDGNFDVWKPEHCEVLETEIAEEKVDRKVIFENSDVKLLDLTLEPKERLQFRKMINDFGINCLSDGIIISHRGDGQIFFVQFKEGDTFFFNTEEDGEYHWDIKNIGLKTAKLFLYEHKTP
jgi:hypothetical protein